MPEEKSSMSYKRTKNENHQWVKKLPIIDFELGIGVLPILIFPYPKSPIPNPKNTNPKFKNNIFSPIRDFHF